MRARTARTGRRTGAARHRRWRAYGRRQRASRRHTPEAGAVCGKAARTDLCGGRSVMGVPTAIILLINVSGQRLAEGARRHNRMHCHRNAKSDPPATPFCALYWRAGQAGRPRHHRDRAADHPRRRRRIQFSTSQAQAPSGIRRCRIRSRVAALPSKYAMPRISASPVQYPANSVVGQPIVAPSRGLM